MFETIVHPTLLIHRQRAEENIRRMALKARQNGVRFRPHFKTHQSLVVAEWFREAGIRHITVSSVNMAQFFAVNGWEDISIAFPVNVRAVREIDQLAARVTLHVLVESREAVRQLARHLTHPLQVWIEIDVGYGRSGIYWQEVEAVQQLAHFVREQPLLQFQGILTHAGHSYKARSREEVLEIHQESVHRMQTVRSALQEAGIEKVEISVGDTPTCSLAEDFSGVDEIRPGNFVFYDLMQWQIGSCREEDIAVALAAPVVAVYPHRHQVVVHGGAVHLSREFLTLNDQPVFGLVVFPEEKGWSRLRPDFFLQSLSQEHGLISVPAEYMPDIKIGDLLLILPVHSCLTMNLMRHQHNGILVI